MFDMYFVYLIQSIEFPNRLYVGFTGNLKQRLETHNSGGSIYTSSYRPWKLVIYLSFNEEIKAKNFEQYLKSSAGKAFITKRFL